MALGARIQLCLTAKGWTQANLLRAVPGLERATLSAIIRRDANRSMYALAIADALGCRLEWLMTGEGIQWKHELVRETDSLYGVVSSDEQDVEQQLLLLFRQLPFNEKLNVTQFTQQRLKVYEQLLADWLNQRGLTVVVREDVAKSEKR